MLGPNIFSILNLPLSIQTHYYYLYFISLLSFTLNIYLIFYLSLTSILNSLSLACKLGLHQCKYKQSPYGFDTRTSINSLTSVPIRFM